MQQLTKVLQIKKNKEILILIIFVLLKLAICLYPMEYGYFCDELYYIALSHHLDWGYVDVPPLLPLCIAGLRYTIGNSLFVLHLFSGITGVVVLVITWMMIKKMGGKLFAQILALVCVTFAPGNIVMESLCGYDCLDKVFWALSLFFVVQLLVSENKKYWIYFGIAVGLGLMSKFDILWLGTGITIALIFTAQRKYFLSYQLWLGGIIALLIVSPYLIWNATHEFLTWEYFSTYGLHIPSTTMWDFLDVQMVYMNLFAIPVWGLGLYYFLFTKNGKRFRLLGIVYLVIFVLCRILNNKSYVIYPFFVVLFSGGAVFIESYFATRHKNNWLWIIYIILITGLGLFFIPYVRPIFSPSFLPKYITILSHFTSSFRTNSGGLSIPQHLYDRFGWEEIAAEFAKVYNSLPLKEKKNVVFIGGRSYSEAAALDFYRVKYNLPPVICGHLQYYLWEPKDLSKTTNIITIAEKHEKDGLLKIFYDVKQIGIIKTKYGFGVEDGRYIYLCKGFRIPPKEVLKMTRKISE